MRTFKLFLATILAASLLVACGTDTNVEKKTKDSANETSSVTSEKNTESSAEPSEAAEDAGEEKEIELDSKMSIALGQEYKLSDQEGLVLESDDEEVVAVDEDGNIHGIKAGKANVEIKDGDRSYTTEIKVKKRGMVYPEYSMMKGEVLDIVFSNKIDPKTVKWTSADKSIAKVTKQGYVKSKKVGETIIKGKKDGVTYVSKIKVTKPIKKVIYLTFDDGPNRYTTPKILKILKKNNVKATFFELKPAKADFDLTKRVLDEGHTLAIHGYEHKYDKIYKSEKIYKANLDKLRNLFFKKFGVYCTLSRFPGGSSNTVSHYNPGIMSRLTKELRGWGYHYIDWNVSSGDAGGANNSDQVFNSVRRELSSGANTILMHDFSHNDKTINALDRVIKYGKKKGYKFKALTPSTLEVHHGVNN